MIRIVAVAAVLAAFAGSSAVAQKGMDKAFCLKTSSGKTQCLYDSMAQCQAAKTGSIGTCAPNKTSGMMKR